VSNHSPITPPEELLEHWDIVSKLGNGRNALTLAYRAGADQELEACKQYMHDQDWFMSPTLRMAQLHNARRPEPPSLKEQALEALQFVDEKLDLPLHNHSNAIHTIRRALEALDD
jgi:hypothetical protein